MSRLWTATSEEMTLLSSYYWMTTIPPPPGTLTSTVHHGHPCRYGTPTLMEDREDAPGVVQQGGA